MLRKKIRWFSYGQKFYLCLAVCPEHGFVKGKIRIKKTEDGFIFAVKTQKLIDEAAAIPAETWFALSRWAKETKNFQPWQRSLLFSVGSLVGRGQKPSIKQATHAMKAYKAAVKKINAADAAYQDKYKGDYWTTFRRINKTHEHRVMKEFAKNNPKA